MINNGSLGIVSRWPLVLIMGTVLAGCFDEKSSSAGAEVASSAIGGGTAPTTIAPATTTNRAPEISGIPAAAGKAGVAYAFTPVASDEDDDFLEFEITNKPVWAEFDAETGTLKGTPTTSHVGTSDEITIAVTDGRERRLIGPFRITVASASSTSATSNVAPTIEGTPATTADVGVAYSFVPVALDADGNKLTFSISNRPAWMAFNTATGQLSGTPAAGNVGTYSNILISVNDGVATTLLPAFAIQVRGPANQAPHISGTPSAAVQATQQYSFQPVGSDPDGDTLTFSITNRPTWATFTASTGRLSGTPTTAGTYSNIVIRVSDGRATASLPAFSISVTAAPAQPAPTQPNRAPTVSGSPSTTAQVGSAYAFQPTATDADNDALAWTIENRPSWLSFNTATGRLSGTPTSTSVASNIIIRVSDGTATASLSAFSITTSAAPAPPASSTGTATLTWQPPTQHTDGTAITDLAGYRVVYGTSQSALNQSITISNPGTTTYVVDGLTSATWYFAVRAFTSDGAESANSGIASKTIQ